MSCSKCGKDGHNSRTCRGVKRRHKNPPRTICSSNNHPTPAEDPHVLWVKFDNITKREADDLLKGVIDVKSSVAPRARGTFAKGSKNEMPKKIAEALKLTSENNDKKQKQIK